MRKKLGLFVIVGILMSAGVASADKGFWFIADGWSTYFNVMNTGASQTATVTFYDEAGVLIDSTSTTLATNANWNFNTSTIGTILATTLEAGTRGVAVISGATAGEIRGHISVFASATASGFQMRIKSDNDSDTDVNW